MNSGNTNKEVVNYYNEMLPYFKNYENSLPYRLNWAMQSLKGIIRPGKEVLDIGCATGITSKFMAELGAKVIGIDIAPDLINYAKEKNSHPNVHYMVGNFCCLDFKKKFDVISLVDVIEHIPLHSVNQAIWDLNNYCHEKTIIYINTPDIYFSNYMMAKRPETKQVIENPYHSHKLIEMFHEHGFYLAKFDVYGTSTNLREYNEYWFLKNGG